MSMFEYEYIPPNQGGGGRISNDEFFSTTLPSVYPSGTPPGMRGEAVRAALRSTQCLAWKLASSQSTQEESPNLASGLLKLEGKGVLDFLNNKLSNSFPLAKNTNFAQACLLTSKGRLVDALAIGYSDTRAFILPSLGHSGSALFQKLDPFIFPMDQVQLTDLSSTSCIFALASTDLQHVRDAVQNHLLPKLKQILPAIEASDFDLPITDESLLVNLDTSDGADGPDDYLVILPHIGMPDCAMVGYTFAFCGSSSDGEAQQVGNQVWQHLIGDDNPKGPVEIKALEYESLRIEAGQPAFGFEVTGAWKEPQITSPTPLELHQNQNVIDVNKGCYLGQEGIASVLKNPRGPPRSLYTVVFEDDDNLYQYQSKGEQNSKVENLTKMPQPGDKLYVLGSNEEIQVGTLTSVAEPYSTGDTTIVGMALIRRADSILKQMKAKDLQIPPGLANKLTSTDPSAVDGSGIIAPPPMDSLDGLEIIVGGTYTVGLLRGVPSRRFLKGKNVYVDQEQILTKEEILEQGYVDIEFSGMSSTDFLEEKAAELESETNDSDEEEEEEASESLSSTAKNTEEAAVPVTTTSTDDAAEAEAKRKAAKMELLKQRAEEAMARRKKKKQEMAAIRSEDDAKQKDAIAGEEDPAEAEARRKAEKMKLLEQRAAEAIARRRKKKETQG